VNDDPPRTMQVLDIYNLHVRHPGMAREITDNYAVNAAVCMERHRSSPRVWSVQMDQTLAEGYLVVWNPPTPAQLRSCANQDDATRDGAYGLALAAVDAHAGFVALRRAEGRSGVDFYLIPDGAEISDSHDIDIDRDDLVGLEVSGIDDDTDRVVRARVREKVEQVRAGKSSGPSIVGVVGFRTARVMFVTVEA
jgi:hypothetical protein